MREKNYLKFLLVVSAGFVMLAAASCKKSSDQPQKTTPTTATPTKLGMYDYSFGLVKEAIIALKVGTDSTDYGLAFDTGSGGMVIDAEGILPPSMITTSGFNFSGKDSLVVKGITVTTQTSVIEYGEDDSTLTKVYGNLAYANITIGDHPQDGKITATRVPFFLYYKAVNAKGTPFGAHEFDLFGSSPEYDITFNNGVFIQSPFFFFSPGTGLTKGFKMAALGASNFSVDGTYVANQLTLGLTASDLSTASGFSTDVLKFYTGEGYLPFLETAVAYNSSHVSAELLFDTGTSPYSYILDPNATTSVLLPDGTSVTATTTSGFNYTYTTQASDNLTYIEAPSSGAQFSLLGIEYFLNNEYMLDYTHNTLGLKVN